MNRKFRKSFLNIDRLEKFCEKELRRIILYPESSDKVIQPLNDVFAVIYNASFEYQTAMRNIQNYIIQTIIHRLKKSRIKHIVKNKCEKDGGVWLYIDIIKNKTIFSILKMRIDSTIPHISFSMYSLSSKRNPINVHDVRKVYRNRYLRNEIIYSKLNLKRGYIELT